MNVAVVGSIPPGHPDEQKRCSWESRQPPKLLHKVQILALLLLPMWLDLERHLSRKQAHAGSTPAVGSFILVV